MSLFSRTRARTCVCACGLLCTDVGQNFTLMEMIQVAAEDHARLGGDASADGEDDDDDVTGGAGLGFPRPAAGSSAGGQSDGASTSDADGVRAASQRAHKRVVVAKDGSVMKL